MYALRIQQLFWNHCRIGNDANTRMIILGEDGFRSQYVPPKPMVKILKRPTADSRGSGDGPLNDDKPKQPIKSLKQVCNCIIRRALSYRTYEDVTYCHSGSKNMRRRAGESWGKRRVRRRRRRRRSTEFRPSRTHRMAIFPATSFACLLARTALGASMYAGSASSD